MSVASVVPSSPQPDADRPLRLGRIHARRLREVYRSAGWPCQDLVEVELLAAGLLERTVSVTGHEVLRVTDAGLRCIAESVQTHRARRDAHEALVHQVAREMARAGRIVYTGLSLRARVPLQGASEPEATEAPAAGEVDASPPNDPGHANAGLFAAPLVAEAPRGRWVMAMPDVFSIRKTTVEAWLHPVVHEIKVRRADLLSDLRQSAKRAAYLDLGGECWYVLGTDARGRAIGTPDDVPPECGVMLAEGARLTVARPAPRRAVERLPLAVWLELAQRTPWRDEDEPAQTRF